jgi:hypothetical protein
MAEALLGQQGSKQVEASLRDVRIYANTVWCRLGACGIISNMHY